MAKVVLGFAPTRRSIFSCLLYTSIRKCEIDGSQILEVRIILQATTILNAVEMEIIDKACDMSTGTECRLTFRPCQFSHPHPSSLICF